jgi:Ricin-type beta-trefoil lectin domain/Putative Ig domain
VRLRRPAALIAVPALAVLGLAGMPSVAGAATAPPRPVAAVAPGASAPVTPHFLSPLPTPALPAGIAQGCATPAHAGQMACDLLVNTQARPRAAIKPNVFPSGFGYGPADLQNAYGLTPAAAAPNTGTVAIVDAFNDPSAEADLGHYRTDAGLPACTVASGCLTIVNQAGATTPLPGTDPTGGWEAEESLDLDMVSAICPNCKILLVEANSANITDLGPAVNYAALHAKFVSNSWGSGGEFIGENHFDSAFNHPGVAITAASGDFGYGTQYPADSQLVTSVGGTTLTGASPTAKGTETAWVGTGSGCSTLEPKPSWQTDTNPTTGCLNRTENDVSAVADPKTGVAIYDTAPNTLGLASGYNEVGGTSASTPIITSTYALAGTPTAGTYPSSYPYQHTSAFNKVTSGSNGTCESTRLYLCNATDSLAGYNGPTGEGTPSGVTGFSEATTGNVVTVLNPGTVDLSDNVKLTLPIQATDSGSGQTLAYSATGLPAGVTINGATGVISGTDTGATGTASVTVTATDGTSASGSVTFNLATVASMAASYHPAAGPARLALGGKCLDDTGNSAANGTKIQIYTCNGDAAQNWEFAPDGFPGAPGVVLIHGKCLDILGLGTANGSKIQLWACSGAVNQQWSMGGFGVLINPASGKCLDDTGRSTTNGTQVQIWSCTGASNQTWTLAASPVQSGVPGKCLDDTGNSAANGNKIQIYTCNGGPAQKWVLAADGTLRVNGKCLDVTGLSLLDGAKIQLWACTGGSNQQWLVGPNGELINVNSSRCLDDTGGSTVNGTQLDQQDCYGSVPEVWAAT